jgi:8-oxo-dGTP pyrophosphatase MutT (NUDIX family)
MRINKDNKKWKTISSKTLVDDRWLKLRVDSCVTPSGGRVDTYYDTDNNLIMIRQYRHGVDDFVSEFVAGGIEKDDPSHEQGIRRELEEEIGYIGGEIYQTGVSYPNPGLQTNKVYSFLAIGGGCSQEPQLEAGESLAVEKIPFSDLISGIENPAPGVIYQAMHIVSFYAALNFIKHSHLDSLKELKEKLTGKTAQSKPS